MRRVLSLVFCLLAASASAETFRFQYQTGDQYRYYGTTTQKVVVDGRFLRNDLLTYRIAFGVDRVSGDTGHLEGHISLLRQMQGTQARAIDHEYETDYTVDGKGVYSTPPNQVMPVVRHVPTFPDRDLSPGDAWVAPGEEVHDMKEDYGIDQLLRVPFDVHYTYEGTVMRDGVKLHAIRSNYTIYKPTGFRFPRLDWYPVLMTGYSHQIHYFNQEKGREEGYTEEYRLELTMNNGQVLEFSGTGESRLEEAKVMDRPAVAEEVRKGLEERGVDADVRVVPRGVVINLDTIRFPGDSAQLLPSEQAKIKLIAEILAKYPDRDILVEGHTANVQGGADPQKLSEARAAAVGDALVRLGARTPEHISYRGWGAEKPLASNDTEAGRAQNRRVEITILEN